MRKGLTEVSQIEMNDIISRLGILKDEITNLQVTDEELYINFNSILQKLKQVLSNYNLNLDVEATEKIHLFLTCLPLLQDKLNIIKFSIWKNKRYGLDYLILELASIINFLLWAMVNSARNNINYRSIISANLLSKILLEPDKIEITLPDFEECDNYWEVFAPIFNYHQTTAGVYGSSIIYLRDMSKMDAIKWCEISLMHFNIILNILENLDLNYFVSKAQEDPDRKPLQMLQTIFWPLYNLLDLLINMEQKFDEEWARLIKPELLFNKNVSNYSLFISKKVVDLLENLLDILGKLQDPEDVSGSVSESQLMIVIMVIKHQIYEINLKSNPSQIGEIVRKDIETIINYYSRDLQILNTVIQESIAGSTLIKDSFVDILMDLYALTALKAVFDGDFTYFEDEITKLNELMSKIDTFLYPKLNFVALLTRIHVKTILGLKEKMYNLQNDLKQFLLGYPDINRDYICLRILDGIIDFYLGVDIEFVIANFSNLKNDPEIKDTQSYIKDELDSYLDYLTDTIKGINCSIDIDRNQSINVWDLKSWLIPDFTTIAQMEGKPILKYIPFNLESDCVR